jgi:NitT/TauT family transport system ATP-binding protein
MVRKIEHIDKMYGAAKVLDGINLSFPEGSITVVVGPSGCGKTSLLNILAGLDTDFSGSMLGFGRDETSYVFQEDRLLPWMDALDNVAFALRQKMDRAAALDTAYKALQAVGLSDASTMKPGIMSGGMRRRVALARAFAFPSRVLLLDEAFSSLDLKTRISVMDLFLDLRSGDGRSAVVVTHDVREAIYLGDRIATMTNRPAKIRDIFDVSLSRAERSFTSGAGVEIETRMYASILSD